MIEAVEHTCNQRWNLSLDNRGIRNRLIDVSDSALLVCDLTIEARVVDLEALNLLHYRLVVREQIASLIRKAIDFAL